MAIQSRTFLGKKIVWEDGLVDHTKANEFSTAVFNQLEKIKKEISSNHRGKYIQDLKELKDRNINHWTENLNEKKSAAQKHIDELKEQASKLRKKERNLTAEEVSVLSYHANMLKSKVALLSSDKEFHVFTQELLETPEQVRQAFLDNAPSILSVFGGNTAEQSSNKIGPVEIKGIMNSVERSLMSDEELQMENEFNSKIKEYEQVKNGVVASEIALSHTINNLNNKIDWELKLIEQANEQDEF